MCQMRLVTLDEFSFDSCIQTVVKHTSDHPSALKGVITPIIARHLVHCWSLSMDFLSHPPLTKDS